MSLLFWKETEEEIANREGRERKYRENHMNELLQKIDEKQDPEALQEAVGILNSLSTKDEYRDFVHAGIVRLRKILWPKQQDPMVYETPIKNYPKALTDLLDLGLNKFANTQNQASS